MDFFAVCRTCLGADSLDPIFTNVDNQLNRSLEIFEVTGVHVTPNDGFSQYICRKCSKFVVNSFQFRQKCKKVDDQLKKYKEELKENEEKKTYKVEFLDKDPEDIKKFGILELDDNVKHSVVSNVWETEQNIVYNKASDRLLCTLCDKLILASNIDLHMVLKHPEADKRKIKSEVCDEYLIKARRHKNNNLSHGSKSLRSGNREIVECDVCKKKMQKTSLKTHKNVIHGGLGPVCEQCGRRFSNKLRLEEHLRARHGEQKFSCSSCEFQSASAAALQNHERRHRGEKPYVCESCGAKFHANYLLTQHRQSHRTERLIKCDMCPAMFKANNALHTHRAARHADAARRCALCPLAFSCRNYVARHMRNVHKFTGPIPELEKVPKQELSK